MGGRADLSFVKKAENTCAVGKGQILNSRRPEFWHKLIWESVHEKNKSEHTVLE